jgi:hypothetical protein
VETRKKEENQYFFDWRMENRESPIKGGFHSLVGEAYEAAINANIGLTFDGTDMIIWSTESKNSFTCKRGEKAITISRIFERRHFKNLCEQKGHGQSFQTFHNSKISNFYVGNCRAPVSDGLVRFSLRARNDMLWTPARKAIALKNQFESANCGCGNQRFCNLLHILNNCGYSMSKMTERHNMVQRRLVEAVMKHRKIGENDIMQNKRISLEKFESLRNIELNELRTQRPYVYFWTRTDDQVRNQEAWKLFIVEFSIPFGRGSMMNLIIL